MMRRRVGLTQQSIADRTGLDRSTIAKMETVHGSDVERTVQVVKAIHDLANEQVGQTRVDISMGRTHERTVVPNERPNTVEHPVRYCLICVPDGLMARDIRVRARAAQSTVALVGLGWQYSQSWISQIERLKRRWSCHQAAELVHAIHKVALSGRVGRLPGVLGA